MVTLKNKFLLLAFLLSVFGNWGVLKAMPAYPYPVQITQSDGTTITIQQHGDEFFNYATTSDGYTVVQENGIYYYAVLGKDGYLTSSKVRASDPGRRNVAETSFIKTISPRIISGIALMRGENTRALVATERAERLAATRSIAQLSSDGVHQAKGIVLLVEFQEETGYKNTFSVAGPDPRATFDNLMNQEGYSTDGAAGSVRDYFLFNSQGKYDIQFDVKGPYKVSQKVSHYGQDGGSDQMLRDLSAGYMIREACELAHEDGVDFSQYAINGEVPNLIVIYAGHGQADNPDKTSLIWQHESTLTSKTGSKLNLGGVTINTYACSAEIFKYRSQDWLTGISPVVHEFSHVLGIPDFYPPDSSVALGLWVFSVMDAGSYLNLARVPPAYNAVERWMCGWLDFVDITEQGTYTLDPLYDNKAYRLHTYMHNEFFVLEFRNGVHNQWDGFFKDGDYTLKKPIVGDAAGMLVYHYDRSTNRAGNKTAQEAWESNTVNSTPSHQCMKLVTTIKSSNADYDDARRIVSNFLFPGANNERTELTPKSSPALLSWAGTRTKFAIRDIKLNGNESVTFTVIDLENPLIIEKKIPSQNSIFISVDKSQYGDWNVTYSAKGVAETSATYKSNDFALQNLKPGTKYAIKVTSDIDPDNFATFEVTTEAVVKDAIPRINTAESFKANETIWFDAVNLAATPKSTEWSVGKIKINGATTTLKADTYQVKCVVKYDNDVEETLIGSITVK